MALLGWIVIALLVVASLCIGALGLGMRQGKTISLGAGLFVAAVALTRLFYADTFYRYLKDFARWLLL